MSDSESHGSGDSVNDGLLKEKLDLNETRMAKMIEMLID